MMARQKRSAPGGNRVHGGWRCFAGCGAGDLLSFHERLTGMGFRDAVAELTGGAA